MHFYHFINKRFRFLGYLTYPETYTYPFYSEYAFLYVYVYTLTGHFIRCTCSIAW